MSLILRYPVRQPGGRPVVIEHGTYLVPDAVAGWAVSGVRRRGGRHPLSQRTAVIEGLGYIQLEVADLGRAIAFYRDGLRFTYVEADNGASPMAVLRAGGFQVALVEARAVTERRQGLCLLVYVSGVDAYHDALVARGLDPTPPTDTEQGRSFGVVDPDGYRWCFRQSLG